MRAPASRFVQIVTRRHPIATTSYLFTTIFGFIFIFNLLGTGKTVDELFPHTPDWVIWAWEWELALGSLLAFVAVCVNASVKRGWPDLSDLLHMEGIGAVVSGMGLITYLIVVAKLLGWPLVGPDVAIFVPLIVGRLWRGTQAIIEGGRLDRVAAISQSFTEGAVEAEGEHVEDKP